MPIHSFTSISLERLYAEHHPWLRGRLQRRLSSRAEAEDVTAETFAQIVERNNAEGLRESRAFLTPLAKRVLFCRWKSRRCGWRPSSRSIVRSIACRSGNDNSRVPAAGAVLTASYTHRW